MAFETKNFFNSTIKQIYQQTGAILSLSSRSDKQLLINSLKLFEANFIYNWQKIHYPLLHGPTGSPYEKYTGMRSKPWAEYDALDSVYGGISGWTLTAEPWANENSLPALWDETNKQPHSITGALYYLSQRIEDLTVDSDELELPQYDDREIKQDINCLEKNLETIYKDVYGCGYTLDCDGGKQNQYSVQTHLFQIFNQVIDGGPQLSIDDSCEDTYPSMSIYMPTSGLTYDVKIPNNQVDGVCGSSLRDDLKLIHSYIGLNNCETSPTYSDYGSLNYLTDGNSLEESLWDLDNAISSFSAVKTLQAAYVDGWSNNQNTVPGVIGMYNRSNVMNTSEGFRLVHGHTLPNWVTGSNFNVQNSNSGEYFEDYMFRVQDLAINGHNYYSQPQSLESPYHDHWHNNFTIGEHEVGRNAGVSLPNPSLKFGDFLYPSVHLYRSILNQTPTSGIPRTRDVTQPYDGYTAYQMDETAIWVATGNNRSGAAWTSLPVNQQPIDCNGDIISADNLYYRAPGDGTIYKLNNCNEITTPTIVSGIFGYLTTDVSNVVVSSVRSDTGETVYHEVTGDALSIKLASTSGDSRVGVGIENPEGKLHVYSGEAGAVTPVSYSNDLIIEGAGGTGLSILTPNANSGNIVFGSASNAANVALRGYHYDGSPKLEIEIDGTTQFKISSTGVEVPGNLTVDGTTTTINSTTLQVDDKNIELGTVDNPTDTTAAGGGITLKAASDKTFTWDSSDNVWSSNIGFRSNGHIYLAADASILLDGTGGANNLGSQAIPFDEAYADQGFFATSIKLAGQTGDEGKIRYNPTSKEFEGNDGTGYVAFGGGSGDNLGDHTATQALDMDDNNITDINQVFFAKGSIGNMDNDRSILLDPVYGQGASVKQYASVMIGNKGGSSITWGPDEDYGGEVALINGADNAPLMLKGDYSTSCSAIQLNPSLLNKTDGTDTDREGVEFRLSSSSGGSASVAIKPFKLNQNTTDINSYSPDLRFYNWSKEYIAIKAPDSTTSGSNYTLTLPPDDGTTGQVLSTNGNGVLTWTTVAAGGSDNLGNHTATQDLDMDGNDIDMNNAGNTQNFIMGNKLRFKDNSNFDTHPDYFFYGKSGTGSPSNKPAKIVLYADDGNTSAGRGEYISIQPPDAGTLDGSYAIKFPGNAPAANKILKIPSDYSSGDTVNLTWADECCPEAATTGSSGTVILTNGNSPVDNTNDDDAVITVAATANIPLSRFDLDSAFSLGASAITGLNAVATSGAYSDLSGTPSLATVATSGSYNDLSNTPTVPTNNNQLTNGAGYVTSNTQLSNEQVQDIVGAMVAGNTESGITVTYDDSGAKLNFSVAGSAGNFADDVDLSSNDFNTSTTNLYSFSTYYVYWSGEGAASNEFIIENPSGFSPGSVIKIHNLKTNNNNSFTLKTMKNSSNVSRLVEITDSGPQTATNNITFPANRVMEFTVSSSGDLLYRN